MTLRGSALIVIDMQEHFREIAEPIISELNKTIEACHLVSIPVIFTQHGHPDPRAEEQSNVSSAQPLQPARLTRPTRELVLLYWYCFIGRAATMRAVLGLLPH